MIRAMGIIFVLSLLCYSAEEDSLQFRKTELNKAITYELNHASGRYKNKFGLPAPNCGQCTDLERLLILEESLIIGVVYPEDSIKKELERIKIEYKNKFNREAPNWKWSDKKISEALKNAIETNAPYRTKEEETTIKSELKNLEAEYEEKFKIPAPWWWVLRSEEERLQCLKEEFKTNKPYYYDKISISPFGSAWDRFSYTYRHGKLSAKYEMRLKKQLPEYQEKNSHDYRDYLERLTTALVFNIPYLILEDEKIKLNDENAKMKAEYKKKFGMTISDFVFSTTSIYFSIGGFGAGSDGFDILAARTTTGIYVKCSPIGSNERLEAELNMREWLDFLRVLCKYTCKWEMEQYRYRGDGICFDGVSWRLEILSLDKDESVKTFSGICSTFPPNWNNFLEEIDIIVTKIKKKNGIPTKSINDRLIHNYRAK